MLTAPEAIEQLIEAGTHRVEMNNAQPFRDNITLADTLEAKAAELISHLAREEQFSLLVQCYRSGQMSEAQWTEHLKDSRFKEYLFRGTIMMPEPTPAPLTAAAIADALDAFWNPAIEATRTNRANYDTTVAVVCIAQGFAAIARHLRGGAS
jgi:hypothetical protein